MKRSTKEGRQRGPASGQVGYEAVYAHAEDELARTSPALAWSGLAAGFSMGFSLLVQAVLEVHTPASDWASLITPFGYAIGFVIVILGRQQLFTENTLTPILPLLTHRRRSTLFNVLRLWGIVLVTNLAGGFLFAWLVAQTDVTGAAVREACLTIGKQAIEHDFQATLLRGIPAGWLIAAMVWLLPFAESSRLWVIIIFAYLVGLGDLSHIIAGGIQTLYLVASLEIPLWQSILDYLLPSLLGNMIGGVAFAAISHAQFVAHRHEPPSGEE